MKNSRRVCAKGGLQSSEIGTEQIQRETVVREDRDVVRETGNGVNCGKLLMSYAWRVILVSTGRT